MKRKRKRKARRGRSIPVKGWRRVGNDKILRSASGICLGRVTKFGDGDFIAESFGNGQFYSTEYRACRAVERALGVVRR